MVGVDQLVDLALRTHHRGPPRPENRRRRRVHQLPTTVDLGGRQRVAVGVDALQRFDGSIDLRLVLREVLQEEISTTVHAGDGREETGLPVGALLVEGGTLGHGGEREVLEAVEEGGGRTAGIERGGQGEGEGESEGEVGGRGWVLGVRVLGEGGRGKGEGEGGGVGRLPRRERREERDENVHVFGTSFRMNGTYP